MQCSALSLQSQSNFNLKKLHKTNLNAMLKCHTDRSRSAFETKLILTLKSHYALNKNQTTRY